MNKYYTRSDLAIESLAYATREKDYKHHQKQDGDISIETFEILQTSPLYPHDIGKYIEISFPDYQDFEIPALLSSEYPKSVLLLQYPFHQRK